MRCFSRSSTLIQISPAYFLPRISRQLWACARLLMCHPFHPDRVSQIRQGQQGIPLPSANRHHCPLHPEDGRRCASSSLVTGAVSSFFFPRNGGLWYFPEGAVFVVDVSIAETLLNSFEVRMSNDDACVSVSKIEL